MAAATYELGAWFNTREGLDRPDGQFLLAPYSFDYARGALTTETFGGMQICAYYLRPQSTGTVRIRSSDPTVLPIITPAYHSHPEDRRAMIEVARTARRFVRQTPLAEMVYEETRPGPEFESDDEIIAAYDRFGNGAYHASGSCRMGHDEASVVDERLRVRGVAGVRVVDTSILPFLVAGNTAAPAMAMAWRAADLVLADANLPAGVPTAA
jgi:choline dehydrogenase-like flavoprotein